MQNLSWKKVSATLLAAGVVALGVFYVTTSKGKRTAVNYVDPAFGEYVSSYTAGIVASGSTIRIVLTSDVVDSTQVARESSVKLFSFSPAVSGKTIWLDRHTVEFVPGTRLSSGQQYEVNFSLSKLVKVPKGMEDLEFAFQVIPQNFEVAINNIKPYIKTDLAREKVEGVLFTADFAEPAAIETMMDATQDGKQLKISWNHVAEGRQHDFIIENVARKQDPAKVSVTVKGESLGINQKQDLNLAVPALGDFRVTNVKVDQGSSQHIVVQFSDPIMEKQLLDGLISMDEVGTLDFEIQDNELRIYPSVRQTGTKTFTLASGIRNVLDHRLKKDSVIQVVFEQLNPAVRFTGKGSILPGTDGLIMPFEAVNLRSVDVQVIKIYEKNVLQFFQVNDFEGGAELRRVGKPIAKTTISLENTGISDLGKWNRFTLDLSRFINAEPGAIYQVRI